MSERKTEELTGRICKLNTEDFHLFLHQILLGWTNQGKWDGRGT